MSVQKNSSLCEVVKAFVTGKALEVFIDHCEEEIAMWADSQDAAKKEKFGAYWVELKGNAEQVLADMRAK